MVGFSSGVAAMLVSAVLGGVGLPFGVPPTPDDPVMGRVAPEQCLFYLSWAGTASPDPKSPNQTEQLLAEPEVQNLLQQLGKALGGYLPKSLAESDLAKDDKIGPLLSEDLSPLIQHISLHAGAVFITAPKNLANLRLLQQAEPTFKAPPPAKDKDAKATMMPKAAKAKKLEGKNDLTSLEILVAADCEFGMVFAMEHDGGEWNERLKKDVEKYNRNVGKRNDALKIVSDGGKDWRCRLWKGERDMQVTIGFHGDYLIVAAGKRSYEDIIARMKQQPPKWWSDISKQLPIDRRSVTIRVDTRALTELYITVADTKPSDSELQNTRTALDMLGLSNVRAWVEVWGLDGYDYVNKSLLLCDGEPSGLLRLISDRPLTPADLSPIPSDAAAAMAFRFDAQQAMEIVLASLEKQDPKQKAEALKLIEQCEKALGLDLQHGALKALGDTWCIYSSPGEGYWPTAVVSLRDWAGMNLAYGRLMGLAKQLTPASKRPRDNSAPFNAQIEQFRFADTDVYCLNGGYFALSSCLTKREMVFGFSPQSVKAYLTHDKRHRSISSQPTVAHLFAKGNAPTAFAYVDCS
jgi:hypothetical protein